MSVTFAVACSPFRHRSLLDIATTPRYGSNSRSLLLVSSRTITHYAQNAGRRWRAFGHQEQQRPQTRYGRQDGECQIVVSQPVSHISGEERADHLSGHHHHRGEPHDGCVVGTSEVVCLDGYGHGSASAPNDASPVCYRRLGQCEPRPSSPGPLAYTAPRGTLILDR